MKPDKNILIDYLYGEISDEKRLEIELYFSQNPAEKVHLEALKNTQNILHKLKDKTPKQPLILMNMDNLTTKNTTKNSQQNSNTTQNKAFFNAFTRNFMGVAACLGFLFLSAYLTKFSIKQTDKGFEVAFGRNNQEIKEKNVEKPQIQPTDEQINQIVKNNNQQKDNQNISQNISQNDTKFLENLINQKMKEKNAYYEQELSTLKNKANNQNSTAFLSSNAGKEATFSNKEVQEMLKQVREQDFEMMRGFIAANNVQQSEYINTAFKSFADYWENKRQQDLSVIGNSITTFKDEAKEKFKENDMILTRLTQK